MNSIHSNYSQELGLCTSLGFLNSESEYISHVPTISRSSLIAASPHNGFSISKKLAQHGSHFLLPLTFGVVGSGVGGTIGLLLKKVTSIFSSVKEEKTFSLPKPGIITTPLIFGFVFCAIGSAAGEYLAQKAFDPNGKTHWGAVVSTGFITFLGGVSGWYAKGLTNYFLFRTAMNFSLTTAGACIDATIEGKSISKSLYSKDFALSLGLSLCLGETFHIAAKQLFKNNRMIKDEQISSSLKDPRLDSSPAVDLSLKSASPNPKGQIPTQAIADKGSNLEATPIPFGEAHPTERPSTTLSQVASPNAVGLKSTRELSPSREIQERGSNPESFADLIPLEVEVSPSRILRGRGSEVTFQPPSRRPTRDSNAPLPIMVPEVTSPVDLNQALSQSQRNRPGRDTPTPRQGIDKDRLLEILFKSHPEFEQVVTEGDIQKLHLPEMIQKALSDEKSLMELAALLLTPDISGIQQTRLSIFKPEQIREIILYLKPALEIFQPERAEWLNFVLNHHWSSHISLNEALYIKAQKALESHRSDIGDEKNQLGFFDIVRTIVDIAISR